MAIKQAYDLSVFADYSQFYVQDREHPGDFSSAWNEETSGKMLAVLPTALGIGTARNMDVPVRLELHDDVPTKGADADRENVAALSIPSGWLQVIGCTCSDTEAFNMDIPPGRYDVLIRYFNLEKLSDDGLDGDDRYLIQMWPS